MPGGHDGSNIRGGDPQSQIGGIQKGIGGSGYRADWVVTWCGRSSSSTNRNRSMSMSSWVSTLSRSPSISAERSASSAWCMEGAARVGGVWLARNMRLFGGVHA